MLSVIIPTLNSERMLVPTLAMLVSGAMSGIAREATVVDGGSTDGTLEVADAAGCAGLAPSAPHGGPAGPEDHCDVAQGGGTVTAMEASGDDLLSAVISGTTNPSDKAGTFVKSRYTVAPCALARRKCSSSRGMISTKLHGR